MADRRRTTALVAGVVAALLWQLTGEIAAAVVNAGVTSGWLAWLPVGTPFSVTYVPDLVPNAGAWVAGMLLTIAVVGVVVGGGVGLLLRERAGRLTMVLSTWMLVVLAGVLAQLVGGAIAAGYTSSRPMTSAGVYSGAGWGVLTGWFVVLVVALSARRSVAEADAVAASAPAPASRDA